MPAGLTRQQWAEIKAADAAKAAKRKPRKEKVEVRLKADRRRWCESIGLGAVGCTFFSPFWFEGIRRSIL